MIMPVNGQTPGPHPSPAGSGLHEVEEARARVQGVAALPTLLAEAFDAFELIRLVARASEDQAPGLLAAFLSAADAAVDGREALTVAPSLPLGRSRLASATVSPVGTGPDEVADALAALAAILAGRLTDAAAGAEVAGDRAACRDAARAAGQIRQLMARGGDDTHLR